MGWRAIYADKLNVVKEEDGIGRPVEDGNAGRLCVIAEEDYGHSVAVDLINGYIAIDYDHLAVQNGTIEITAKLIFAICDETNIVGEFKHLEHVFEPWYTCNKTKFIDKELPDGTTQHNTEVACEGSTSAEPCDQGHPRTAVFSADGTPTLVRTDVLTPLLWRPIWFIRHTMPGGSTKVIGAQVTLPESQGGHNIKKLVSLFEDGRIGID